LAASDIDELATTWAAKRTAQGWARSPRWPAELFRFAATDFLRAIGRLAAPPAAAPGRYDRQIEDFAAAQHEGRWLSEATCQAARWQVGRFLGHLEQQGIALGDVEAAHVDRFFQHMALRWSRTSLHTSAKMLRSWFAHCEDRGWVRPGLAAAVLLPRIYREEGLPLGPTWDQVGRMLAETAGDEPVQMRDHAILRLLSVYGLRSGEVRRLTLEDLESIRRTNGFGDCRRGVGVGPVCSAAQLRDPSLAVGARRFRRRVERSAPRAAARAGGGEPVSAWPGSLGVR
jgi:integrase